MSAFTPRLLYVSASDRLAPYTSISAALQQAVSGDTVLVGDGRYSPAHTGERFPLYVPPGVTLAGMGQRGLASSSPAIPSRVMASTACWFPEPAKR
jgi:hypothetical protein